VYTCRCCPEMAYLRRLVKRARSDTATSLSATHSTSRGTGWSIATSNSQTAARSQRPYFIVPARRYIPCYLLTLHGTHVVSPSVRYNVANNNHDGPAHSLVRPPAVKGEYRDARRSPIINILDTGFTDLLFKSWTFLLGKLVRPLRVGSRGTCVIHYFHIRYL